MNASEIKFVSLIKRKRSGNEVGEAGYESFKTYFI